MRWPRLILKRLCIAAKNLAARYLTLTTDRSWPVGDSASTRLDATGSLGVAAEEADRGEVGRPELEHDATVLAQPGLCISRIDDSRGDAQAELLAGDGNMAWRAALCYIVTGDARFAHHAQSIVSAWGDTLVRVRSEQGSSEINFDLPTYVLAASLVRGVDDWNDGCCDNCWKG